MHQTAACSSGIRLAGVGVLGLVVVGAASVLGVVEASSLGLGKRRWSHRGSWRGRRRHLVQDEAALRQVPRLDLLVHRRHVRPHQESQVGVPLLRGDVGPE